MKSTRGFTLIELLIVIALLGALAVGLLATIDPFEQLKKGRDTSQRNTVSEFYNANLRYYSTKGEFPWATDTLATTKVSDLTDTVDKLTAAGELKTNFIKLAGEANVAKLFVTATGPEKFSVCYSPESKGFQIDPNTIYNSAGVTPNPDGICKSVATTEEKPSAIDCYYCIQ